MTSRPQSCFEPEHWHGTRAVSGLVDVYRPQDPNVSEV